ncbi:hypothetical protein QTQ03_24220 [Micromonospora sp. WMMA1363]|uniref:hypothetical protein n=1 Tax=Micromonospora sp. WMMA1363 TaxID=3053985 RepID=UPI00259CF733|nr:hypothetical protein [Micromonospora sp. WMMA1363]MDM4722545.1 hypothetical protein [Micromonospora sp. WMMA1363]
MIKRPHLSRNLLMGVGLLIWLVLGVMAQLSVISWELATSVGIVLSLLLLGVFYLAKMTKSS